jgi:hypothetical protein
MLKAFYYSTRRFLGSKRLGAAPWCASCLAADLRGPHEASALYVTNSAQKTIGWEFCPYLKSQNPFGRGRHQLARAAVPQRWHAATCQGPAAEALALPWAAAGGWPHRPSLRPRGAASIHPRRPVICRQHYSARARATATCCTPQHRYRRHAASLRPLPHAGGRAPPFTLWLVRLGKRPHPSNTSTRFMAPAALVAGARARRGARLPRLPRL